MKRIIQEHKLCLGLKPTQIHEKIAVNMTSKDSFG